MAQGYALGKAQEIAWRAGKSIHIVCGEAPEHLRAPIEFPFNFRLDGGEIADFPGRPEKPTAGPASPSRHDGSKQRGGGEVGPASCGSRKALEKK